MISCGLDWERRPKCHFSVGKKAEDESPKEVLEGSSCDDIEEEDEEEEEEEEDIKDDREEEPFRRWGNADAILVGPDVLGFDKA